MCPTERLDAEDGLARAAALLQVGETIAFPTETVYGLGADATDGAAVARIYEAKSRPSFNPLIVHVGSVQAACRLIDLPDPGLRLAEAFWPGPLTLVAPMRPDSGIADLVTAGLPTLAVRVPAHPLASRLIEASGLPLAAPSANPSGRISPTTAAHVLDGLEGRIAAVLDGGACPVGLESTIVHVSPEGTTLLRPGGVPAEEISRITGDLLEDASDEITAPGRLASHYAPASRLRLNAHNSHSDEVMLGFGSTASDLNLSPSGDLREAAANLFAHLRALDRLAAGRMIAVAPIPDAGLGAAINDRLRRAAAPR
ncbi:MAG: L-threonylcarbamoyladenylate synthase [Pseudomonadota bacterium]